MSNNIFIQITDTLQKAIEAQTTATRQWHEQEVQETPCAETATQETLQCLIAQQHLRNFRLWHVEDTARRKDVDSTVIADCKYKIDVLNQQRNDLIEKVDSCLVTLLHPTLPRNAQKRYNTETPGMAVDRLSILSLKTFHMGEQTERTDVDENHRQSCRQKLLTLEQQRHDLFASLLELLEDYREGRKMPKLYHQFKMYNDPALNPELYKNK